MEHRRLTPNVHSGNFCGASVSLLKLLSFRGCFQFCRPTSEMKKRTAEKTIIGVAAICGYGSGGGGGTIKFMAITRFIELSLSFVPPLVVSCRVIVVIPAISAATNALIKYPERTATSNLPGTFKSRIKSDVNRYQSRDLDSMFPCHLVQPAEQRPACVSVAAVVVSGAVVSIIDCIIL